MRVKSQMSIVLCTYVIVMERNGVRIFVQDLVNRPLQIAQALYD